ncbi:MAG: universal stress protein [Bacteroidia bacterium]|nr:universal stress protein [Bacteroidia bacterium]
MSTPIKNILVAVDLKSTDNALLQIAMHQALAFKAKTWIIHVAAPDPLFVGYKIGPQYIRDSRADTLKEEHHTLYHYMKSMEDKGAECTALLIQGSTLEMLLKEIEKLKIDLVIMGEHRHGLMYESFIGHTSTKILKNTNVPVLIVPIANED